MLFRSINVGYCFSPKLKFVNLTAAKKFAAETEEEAIKGYKRRLLRRICLLKDQLEDCETQRKLAYCATNDEALKSSPFTVKRSFEDYL